MAVSAVGKELRDALREHSALFEAHVATDVWSDGTAWVGVAFTEGEAAYLIELLLREVEE